MKRIAIIVLSLVMVATLCACGCTNDTPATTTDTGSSPNTQTDRMPTENVTIPIPETNVPDTGVDNDTMPGEMDDGTNGVTGNGDARSNFPMGGMQ